MHIRPTYVIHGCHLITSKKNKVEIMDNKLVFRISFYVFNNLPTNPIKPMFFGVRFFF
jgi:hypothetical protein